MSSLVPSQPTSPNPSSPTSLCLQTLPAPGPHVPLEPTPPYLSREGVLGPPYRGPKGVCQGPSRREPHPPPPPPPRSTFSPSSGPTRAQSHPLAHTSILRGLSTPPASGSGYQCASRPGRAGADGCPGWGAGCHRACPPPVWVPIAQHAPGLEGVSPLQLPVSLGSGGRAGRSRGARRLPGSARVRAAPSSSSSPNRAEPRRGCGGKWYCIAGSVPSSGPLASRGPKGRVSHGLAPKCGSSSVRPLPPENGGEPAKGGGGPWPPPYVSFCK
uniref:Uncharacterized protein n=1 Tax=Pipistrellus kuhlii TaxID=59472 RepID=A0A7J7V0K2_PIPKU|nr:hypothetical protein mPipKuh1_008653 [Pipistrellus kuhlii]